jgi:PAS domain S-box-containing protein
MAGYYGLYVVFLAIGIAISLYLIARLWMVNEALGAKNLIWAILCITIWSFGYIFEITEKTLALKTFFLKVEDLGISFAALAIFTFILIYSGRGKWLTRTNFILLAIIPAASFILAATNDWHHLLWSDIQMHTSLIGPLILEPGPWSRVIVVYSYALLFLAAFFLVQIIVRVRNLYRPQALIMLVGIIIPWIANILYVFHSDLDLTPLACTLTIIALEIGFSHLGLMDIVPADERQILNLMREGIIVTDEKGRIVRINPSAQRFFHQSENQLVGENIHKLFPAWSEGDSQTGSVFEIGREIVFGKGPNERIYNFRIAPILGRKGRLTGQIGTLTDITDEKQAQSQMHLQSAALEVAENGIVITDDRGKVVWANPAFSRLTGYEFYEVTGKSLRILKSGEQSSHFYKKLWDTILAGKVWHGELVNRRKDGTTYHEEMTITPLMENGDPTHFIAIKQDVSERKLAEERLRQAHEQAMDANRMKTQLLAGVSHDLRTPLGTIMGYAEILQTGVLGSVNDEQKNAAAEILDSSNRLLAFVNNLIGQAQIETGRIVIRPRSFKPVDLTDGVRSLVSFMAQKKGINLETEIDPFMPEQVCADLYWLKQILYNLVTNALKFTSQGSVKIRLFRANDDQWALQVSDSGVGIPAESQSTIFEPFQQIDRKGVVEGSGLGLSIVHQLTSLMNGKIELKSEIGKGSTFTVILPLKNS